jgi:hypothetical protein
MEWRSAKATGYLHALDEWYQEGLEAPRRKMLLKVWKGVQPSSRVPSFGPGCTLLPYATDEVRQQAATHTGSSELPPVPSFDLQKLAKFDKPTPRRLESRPWAFKKPSVQAIPVDDDEDEDMSGLEVAPRTTARPPALKMHPREGIDGWLKRSSQAAAAPHVTDVLEQVGLVAVSNAGDGDCLYLSLLQCMPATVVGRPSSVHQLRLLFVLSVKKHLEDEVLAGLLNAADDDSDAAESNSATTLLFLYLQAGHWNDSLGDVVLDVLVKELRLHVTVYFAHSEQPPRVFQPENLSPVEQDALPRLALLKSPAHWEACVAKPSPHSRCAMTQAAVGALPPATPVCESDEPDSDHPVVLSHSESHSQESDMSGGSLPLCATQPSSSQDSSSPRVSITSRKKRVSAQRPDELHDELFADESRGAFMLPVPKASSAKRIKHSSTLAPMPPTCRSRPIDFVSKRMTAA